MGLYEAAKDALKVAQSVDNVDLVQKLLDVQKEALEMQNELQKRHEEISDLKLKIKELEENKRYVFAEGKKYLIDPEYPSRQLCPICTKKHNIATPLNGGYCAQCKGNY